MERQRIVSEVLASQESWQLRLQALSNEEPVEI
jgi:hypothetical protein